MTDANTVGNPHPTPSDTNLTDLLAHYQQALSQHQEQGDRTEEANTLNELGLLHKRCQQLSEAIACHQQALAIFEQTSDRQRQAITLGHLATTYYTDQSYDQALETYQQSLPIFEEVGDRYGLALTWYGIGGAMWHLQRMWDAQDAYRHARDLYVELGQDDRVQHCEVVIDTIEQRAASQSVQAPNLEVPDEVMPDWLERSLPSTFQDIHRESLQKMTSVQRLPRGQRRSPRWLRFVSYFVLGLVIVLVIASLIAMLTG